MHILVKNFKKQFNTLYRYVKLTRVKYERFSYQIEYILSKYSLKRSAKYGIIKAVFS